MVKINCSTLKPSEELLCKFSTDQRLHTTIFNDQNPNFMDIACILSYSWDEMRYLLSKPESIMKLYEATKEAKSKTNCLRYRKIRFLGECMYEYIQRYQFHKKIDLTEEIICKKAAEFRDVIAIENFMPDRAWIDNFEATYNITLPNHEFALTRTPHSSLDARDIIVYCTKYKSKQKKKNNPQDCAELLYCIIRRIAVSIQKNVALDRMALQQQRQIDLLERSLSEYITRVKYQEDTSPEDTTLTKVALKLKQTLKINNFDPDEKWLNTFKYKHAISLREERRRPHTKLRLRSIIKYCRKKEDKNKHVFCGSSIKQNDEEQNLRKRRPSPSKGTTGSKRRKIQSSKDLDLAQSLQRILNLNINPNAEEIENNIPILDDDEHVSSEDDEELTKPKSEEIQDDDEYISSEDDEELTKPKSEEIQNYMPILDDDEHTPISSEDDEELTKGKSEEIQNYKPILDDYEYTPISSEDDEEFTKPKSEEVEDYISILGDDEFISSEDDEELTKPKSDDIDDDRYVISEYNEELPKQVKSYSDALMLLKPLQESDLIQNNFNAKNLISALESLFKESNEE